MNNLRSADYSSVTADGCTTTNTTSVACDACVLINFLNIDRMDILAEDVSRYRFVVPDTADAEVTRPTQRGRLDLAYRERIVYRAGTESVPELIEFEQLTQSMGKGEAACLALAMCRGWMLASDEGNPFRRMAIERIGENRLIGTVATPLPSDFATVPRRARGRRVVVDLTLLTDTEAGFLAEGVAEAADPSPPPSRNWASGLMASGPQEATTGRRHAGA